MCFVVLAACDVMPRDTSGTRQRVESSQVIRVGLLQGPLAASAQTQVSNFLGRIGRLTGARSAIVTGPADPLLSRLEDGELDLVIGEIASDSPWIENVAVIEPLAERRLAGRTIGLSPIARNGENRWIVLLEGAVRDQRSGG